MMRVIHNLALFSLFAMAAALSVFIIGTEAWAAESANPWRPTYDLILRWLNFLILAFLIVKYGRGPLMDFLKGRKKELALEIGRIEGQKDQATASIKDTQQKLAESEKYFAELKDKIVQQGEKTKEKIIEDAQRQSRYILEDAKKKIGNQMLQAKSVYRAELVDAAIALATQRLPQHINEDDNQKFFNLYMKTTMTK